MSFGESCGATLLVICLVLFVVPALELWLWGLVMVPVFSAPIMTYWQMFALNWLCGLLFRSRTTVNTKK